MDTDSFVLGIKAEISIQDLKNLDDFFVFIKSNENLEPFNNKNKKLKSKFKIEFPKNI